MKRLSVLLGTLLCILVVDVSAAKAGGFLFRRRARRAVVVQAPFVNVAVGRGFNNVAVVRQRVFVPRNNVVYFSQPSFVQRSFVQQQPVFAQQRQVFSRQFVPIQSFSSFQFQQNSCYGGF